MWNTDVLQLLMTKASQQGVHMVGKPGDGPGVEGAPVSLLERVTEFLTQERARLRHELNKPLSGPQYSAFCAAELEITCTMHS
jgi:hypothetical protein